MVSLIIKFFHPAKPSGKVIIGKVDKCGIIFEVFFFMRTPSHLFT